MVLLPGGGGRTGSGAPAASIRAALNGGVARVATSRRVERRHRCADFLAASADCGRNTLEDRPVVAVSAAAFMWPTEGWASSALAAVATSASVGAAGGQLHLSLAGAPGVEAACLPLLWLYEPPRLPGAAGESAAGGGAEDEGSLSSSRVRSLRHAIQATCYAGGLVATMDLALNDPVSGLIGCGVAALGLQASTPQGARYLPSYIVLAFCNGSMEVLLGIEAVTSRGLGIAGLLAAASKAPLAVKVGQALYITSPALMFTGLVFAWNLHCELRSNVLQSIRAAGNAPAGMPRPPPGASTGGVSAAEDSAAWGFQPFSGAPHRLLTVEEPADTA